jgi:hypothetical protein
MQFLIPELPNILFFEKELQSPLLMVWLKIIAMLSLFFFSVFLNILKSTHAYLWFVWGRAI